MNIAQTTITTVTPNTSGHGSPSARVSYPKSQRLVRPAVTWSAVALSILAQIATATRCDKNVIHIAMKSAKERKLRSRLPLDVFGGGRMSASFFKSLHVKAEKYNLSIGVVALVVFLFRSPRSILVS